MATRKMPEKWEQVKELFTLALEREAAERSDFLRQACGDNDALRSEVESLLSSFYGAATFLEDSPAADLLCAQSRTMVGKRIGAYRILGEIGHGGMAVVYLAERADDQYRKRVAIKMLQPGTNKDEILRRFRNERQALAALDHPSIVRLLDGGSTEEGLPYLIMEYVEGVRIDEYCDTHRLSITERLQLFCAVCLAVQYAHETLVIHRDLDHGIRRGRSHRRILRHSQTVDHRTPAVVLCGLPRGAIRARDTRHPSRPEAQHHADYQGQSGSVAGFWHCKSA